MSSSVRNRSSSEGRSPELAFAFPCRPAEAASSGTALTDEAVPANRWIASRSNAGSALSGMWPAAPASRAFSALSSSDSSERMITFAASSPGSRRRRWVSVYPSMSDSDAWTMITSGSSAAAIPSARGPEIAFITFMSGSTEQNAA